MGFSRQEYWSGLPFPSPGDFSDPGIEPMSPVSPALQADPLHLNSQRKPIHFKGFDLGKSILSPVAWYPWRQEELLVHFGCA